MKLTRTGTLLGLALSGALALSACGSDNTTAASTSSSGSAGASSGSGDCAQGSLTGAGSSAQANAMAEWVKQYQQRCTGASINYQSVGSGAGIQQFTAGTVDFAGSDSALKDAEQGPADARCGAGNKAINLPMVVGPIGIAYTLQGVDDLVLDGPTAAKIFSGAVKTWDDPAIKALNPDAQLPGTPIQAFHRSDSSGTTDNFTKYLKAAGGSDWTFDPGKEWAAPGGQGAKGNEGIAAAVQQTEGAVGYLEQSFIENGSLDAARIKTGGEPVELTTEAAGKAVEAAQLVGTGNDLKLSIDYGTTADGVYPIVLVTYEIVCEKGTDPAKVALLTSFLDYTASSDGQDAISEVGYGALPQSFIDKVRASVQALS